jgi:hypothetical protein
VSQAKREEPRTRLREGHFHPLQIFHLISCAISYFPLKFMYSNKTTVQSHHVTCHIAARSFCLLLRFL